MKRLQLFIPLFAAAVFLAGCNQLGQGTDVNASPTPSDVMGESDFDDTGASNVTPAMTLESGQSTNTTIYQTAVEAGNLTVFTTAVQAAGLEDVLAGPGPFTVFIPSDSAFQKLPPSTVTAVLNDRNQVTGILSAHIVNGRYLAADLAEMSSIETIQETEARISMQNNQLMIENATVITQDIQATNGVIHIIDTVILPSQ